MPTLFVGAGVGFGALVLAFLLSWFLCWRSNRLEFLMPELLDAPTSLTAQATRDRAVALGLVREAPQLVTATLAYVATVNQLMAQGLSLVQANSLLKVRSEGALYSFVGMSATRVASERQALLK